MYRGRRKVAKKDKDPIPKTLEEFGYVIKDDGSVRSITTDAQYVFEYEPKAQAYNEARYQVFINLLGDVVEERLQQAPLHFQKVTVPIEADPTKNEPHTYIYMTPNALTTTKKLLLFMPGLNTRIGQWNRRVMCDESITAGSMLDMANMAKEHDYEMMIFNPNGLIWYDNAPHDTAPAKYDHEVFIPGNESPENHCQYVFQHFVRQAKAEKIGILGLGWGGHCFTLALNDHFDIIKSKVAGVALANSGHAVDFIQGEDKRTWFYDHVVNWTISDEPKGSRVPDVRFECECLSAGADLPDYVIWKCTEDMMRLIGIKLGDITVKEEEDQGELPSSDEIVEADLKELDDVLI